MEVKFYDNVKDELLEFAVIISRFQNKWVFCKHKERETLEISGGHREPNELIDDTAHRELREETGAIDFSIKPVCAYSVKGNINHDTIRYGMLYCADIINFEDELHNEMERIFLLDELPTNLTYPLIHPKLIEEAVRRRAINL